jgi:hypothetical protein
MTYKTFVPLFLLALGGGYYGLNYSKNTSLRTITPNGEHVEKQDQRLESYGGKIMEGVHLIEARINQLIKLREEHDLH